MKEKLIIALQDYEEALGISGPEVDNIRHRNAMRDTLVETLIEAIEAASGRQGERG